jgi:hypothetical protein
MMLLRVPTLADESILRMAHQELKTVEYLTTKSNTKGTYFADIG